MRTFPVAILLALLLACGEPSPPEAPAPPEPAAPEPAPAAPGAAEVAKAVPPEPPPARPPQPAAQPAAIPKPAAAPKPAAEVASAPQPLAPGEPAPEAAPTPAPQPAPTLDLDGLERRLKETSALGVLTKLALKNEIDDLIEAMGRYHKKQRGELPALRERFDLLVMKVTSLLQDKEPELAREVAAAREGLWKLLADPAEFAKLKA